MEQDVECLFHFSTIIFKNANTTYSNEQNLIVFSRIRAEFLILKIPQPEYRSVFEMNKYQEMGVRT